MKMRPAKAATMKSRTYGQFNWRIVLEYVRRLVSEFQVVQKKKNTVVQLSNCVCSVANFLLAPALRRLRTPKTGNTTQTVRYSSSVDEVLVEAQYAVSSARLATIQDTIRETSCPASDNTYTYEYRLRSCERAIFIYGSQNLFVSKKVKSLTKLVYSLRTHTHSLCEREGER